MCNDVCFACEAMILLFTALFSLFIVTQCTVNLYVSNSEVQRILGFNAELYYISQGQENENAIKYQLLIPENIQGIKFRWQDVMPTSCSSHSAYASTTFTHGNNIIYPPTLALPSEGKIPIVEKEFLLNISCKPKVEGSAIVYLHLNITNIKNYYQKEPCRTVNLKFSFNKLCRDISFVDEENESPESYHFDYEDDDDSGTLNKTSIFYIAVGVGCTVILAIAIAVGFLHVHSMPKLSEDKKDALLSKDDLKEEEIATKVIPQVLKAAIAEKRQKELMLLMKDYVIRRNLLTIGNTVQEGSFGRAYLGNLINAENGEELKVLVKTVTDQASPEQKTLFLAESCFLKRITHHNILPVIHVIFDELKPPLVIYQYMNRGNLKNYLRLSRTAEPLLKPLTTRDIVLMALQIARGLQYLCRRHIIHKDVATRNCVVDEELHVKVCDNALARDFFPGDYHCLGDNENRPIRWMAVECLESNTFVPVSDVWSYGVLLWELCSLAQTPYANVDPFEMLSYLKSGLRLPQPLNCPDDLFTVMACCWALSPEERPHFTQIMACLDAFFNKLNAFI